MSKEKIGAVSVFEDYESALEYAEGREELIKEVKFKEEE